MKKFKSYKLIIYSLLFSVIYSQNDYYFYYSLNQGANLLSFPIVLLLLNETNNKHASKVVININFL